MSSHRQIEANRRNAAKSTGPKTAEGRAAVRHNALTHGLTAEILLPIGEDQADFEQLRRAFEDEYHPVGPTERGLLETIIAAQWRLSRAPKIEAGFFKLGLEQLSPEHTSLDGHLRLARVVDNDCSGPNTLSKLSRYEAHIERSFYKALKELQRLQSLRTQAAMNFAKQSQSQNRTPIDFPAFTPPKPPFEPCSGPFLAPPAASAARILESGTSS